MTLVLAASIVSSVGALAALMSVTATEASPHGVRRLRAWVSCHLSGIKAVAASAAVIASVAAVAGLWDTANTASRDVLASGTSKQGFLGVPVIDLLGVRPEWVSPCLIHLGGDQAPVHLAGAVIVGGSAAAPT